tara:strand:+ start:1222 stop:1380 length:159 start_codon:yes stop_codon:yes gene_type:complete
MNLQEFLFMLATVFFTTGFITWLRISISNLVEKSEINRSTAESLKLFRNENK